MIHKDDAAMTLNSLDRIANGVDGGYRFTGDGKVVEYVNSKFIEYNENCYIAIDQISTISLGTKTFISKEPVNDLWSTRYDIHPDYIKNFERLVGK